MRKVRFLSFVLQVVLRLRVLILLFMQYFCDLMWHTHAPDHIGYPIARMRAQLQQHQGHA